MTSEQMENKLTELMAEAIKKAYSDPIHNEEWQEVRDNVIQAKESLKKAVE
ncbi:MAG: hypothetical protein K6E33_05430 [Lachnospiraceae bacterium]|nr:hypothetical protein [Lachnospiraceae bacterium]